MHLSFRVLDLDVLRLKAAELTLRRYVRAHGINADICLVHDFLELGRLGVADKLPALELNGVIVSAGRTLTEAMFECICRSLASSTVCRKSQA